jgi:hypothetical protein
MNDDQRFAASYDWDLVVMGDYLAFLQSRQRRGELSAEQEKRYVELKAKLRAALPIIERPPIPERGPQVARRVGRR